MPKLLLHVFHSDSKSVTFGWVLYITATALYVARMPGFEVDIWQNAILIATLLIGGKVVKETILDGLERKAKMSKP